ncbi:MAG: hypothetical protein J3Q66DRAFT_355858 [Benniella sp.]|nr:MAG: hypothetical protein J3Q66DRAFT_355858 [Benniella sp.]
MFARPVDPFLSYNSYNATFPSTEAHHKNMFARGERLQRPYDGEYRHRYHKDQRHQIDQDFGHDQQPHMDPSQRRKRSFHFEPEFVEALDASLHEPSRPRPSKKLRRTVTFQPLEATTSDGTASVSNQEPGHPIFRRKSFSARTSGGPSIIDLSSGEELEALHLGENEHKRRRDSAFDSGSSAESLREVYDVLEDGSLCPVMDHAPVKPSPTKRIRVEEPMVRSKLETLDDQEDEPRIQAMLSEESKDNEHLDKSEEEREDLSRMEMSIDEESSKPCPSTLLAERGALVRYEGPISMTLADGVEGLLKHRWRESQKEMPILINAQGNELVLYRRPPPSVLASLNDSDIHDCVARIEELDDDDDDIFRRNAHDNDDQIHELEEGIMDMDLD